MVSFTHLSLYPGGKNPRYLLDRRLVGAQSPSGGCGEEIEFLPLPEIELLSSNP
jgi:hypothetical protein